MGLFGYNPVAWSISTNEYYRAMKQQDELLIGQSRRNGTVAALTDKANEVRGKIAAERKRKTPDEARLERLNQILANLESTLARCR